MLPCGHLLCRDALPGNETETGSREKPANSHKFFIKFSHFGLYYDFMNVASSFTKNKFCLRTKLSIATHSKDARVVLVLEQVLCK